MSIDRFDYLLIAPQNFDASLRFYRDVMKWDIVNEWKSKDGARSVVLSGGGIEVLLVERHKESEYSILSGVNGATPTLHLDIHDVQKRFELVPPGEHVVVEPQDTHWGVRWFVLKDPDGNLIAFNERRQKH